MRNSVKRFLSILLILGMLFSFSACQKGKNMWDPYGEESSASVSASPSGSVPGETVTETVDEHPYFSGKAVTIFPFSEDCLWLHPSVIEMDDCIGFLFEIPVYKENSEPSQEPEYEYQLKIFDFDGNLISELDLSECVDEGDIFSYAEGDQDNNIRIFLSGKDSSSVQEVVVDKNGQVIESKHDVEQEDTFGGSFYDMEGNTYTLSSDPENPQITVYDPDGQMISFFGVDFVNESGYPGVFYELGNVIYLTNYSELYPIDFEAETIGEPIVVNADRHAWPLLMEQGIFFEKADGLYKFDMTTQETRKILSYNDMDLDITEYSISTWIPVSDEIIIGIGEMSQRATLSSGSYGSIEMVVLKKQETNPNLNKEVLILGGFNISADTDLLATINKFNFQNTEYRVEIRDYHDSLDGSIVQSDVDPAEYYRLEYSQAAEQLTLDILNGNAPDLLLCSSSESGGFPTEHFETQGLLLDLYELSAGDETFHKEDYVQSILSLLEVDGKLYRFPMSFSMQGLIGPTRLIGDRSNWTIEEFNEFASGLPTGAIVFPNQSKKYLMQNCLSSSMATYVDYNQGLTNFDSPEFCQLLEFVNTYGGEELNWDNLDVGDIENPEGWIDSWELMAQGMLAVDIGNIYTVADMANNRFNFQEPVTFLGYPSSSQSGMVCSVSNTLSISSDCDNPEAAWSFISLCISEESQSENFMFGDAPIHRGVLEEKTYKILNSPNTDAASWYMMAEVTQEDVDLYLALVDSISVLSGQDAEIMNIVNEEAQAYYQGAKTAEDVAAIIQNRVSIFVSEVS